MSEDYDYFTMLGDRTKHYSFEFRIQVSEKEIEVLESINCEDKPFSISFLTVILSWQYPSDTSTISIPSHRLNAS